MRRIVGIVLSLLAMGAAVFVGYQLGERAPWHHDAQIEFGKTAE
jgi:hypothetical protein